MKKCLIFSLLVTTTLWGHIQSWDRLREDTVSRDLPLLPGWNTKEQADHLMSFVYKIKPQIAVEIGAFGGGCTYPIAVTLRYLKSGVVYAIDAWDSDAVRKGFESNHPHNTWWNGLNVDLEAVHKYLESLITRANLGEYCFPFKMLSAEASPLFLDEQIDFLFLDGNQSAEGTMQDVTLYFPKVKKGGYIWLHNADMPTKNKATTFLMQNCEWLKEDSLGIRCLVFKKN